MSSKKAEKSGLNNQSINDDTSINSKSSLENEFSDDEIEFTSSEDLQSVRAYDNTVEIVGYIDAIEAPRIVGTKNNKIFKFFVNNNRSERVQVTCWNEECDRIEPLLRTTYIVHIDGAYAKPSLVSNFNKGTINYELILQSNTIINILGKHNVSEFNIQSELVLLSDVLEQKNMIRTQGYIKSNFYQMNNHAAKSSDYGCGSITDGIFKLPIRITESIMDHEFNKGDHVEVKGYIQSNANPVYLLIKSLGDIKLLDEEKMPIKKLLKGNKILENKQTSNDSSSAKKPKLNNTL